MTKQRAAILKVLRKKPGHYTAESIFQMAKNELPTISRATVYNNLASLVEERAMCKILGAGSSVIYDTTTMPHAHAVCSKCSRVEDLFLEQLDRQITKELGMPFDNYDLTVRYVCNNCRECE